MFTLTIISILLGTALGLRCRVLVLVPTIGLALAVVAVAGIAGGDGVWQLLATMAVVATFIELGYIGGVVLRVVIGVEQATHNGDHAPFGLS
jgi:O-antigen ligase